MIADMGHMTAGKANPVFEMALREFRLNRTAPIRAYYGLIDNLQWGPCVMCAEVGFIAPSGLAGMTCSRCEMEMDHVMEERADD